ncbi:hypothetical protein [Legionella hackeliae]|uniref:Uncharacterized protein n=1 Tax=Legionella hackeliae TaxID=449 RepID=A0A0A8UXL1_LEGHA|nr:hypothetical protein [Legionella hackeliae]KTD13202.1 hypothetical protein Lhac_1071 [Legionella hackeliae]CEK11484.1 protein of unknown function [Legionella hackeliae]STX48253.1 Uncharacterised protein [Legionella hackeliae]
MKRKIEPNSNKEETYYINYIRLDKTIILFRNWLKNKSVLVNNPCDEKATSVYPIAKLVNPNNPLPLLMPEVTFSSDYCSAEYETWEELYLKDDIFISLEFLLNNKPQAFSLETVFLSNKHNGYLRTTLRYGDKNQTAMSLHDQERFLAQLQRRYPSYYKDYLDVQPSEDDLLSINIKTLNHLLDAVEVMLVLSCHKGGLRSVSLPNSVTDYLSALGYELLLKTISENLTKTESEGLKKFWAKNIHNQSEKTVHDLLDSALNGACTTTLGLYWLGLLREFRQNFSLKVNDPFLNKFYETFILNNPVQIMNISKKLFVACIRDNMRYIVGEMLHPEVEQQRHDMMLNSHNTM